ncbi:MAG: hypothetical protein J5931_02560 [Prevotella sp.]|nr:hypothetical protein [Prevotella sp.]
MHEAISIRADTTRLLPGSQGRTRCSPLPTTIYDTEGKERQIAEQRAELSQQRLFTVGIVTLILIIFFLIYTIQRRKAYRALNATNRQLMLANERAEESSRMKTEFIQKISHEVRTPLNLLSGYSQVLGNMDIEIDEEELQDICGEIVKNSERITSMVDKFIDMSMIYSNTGIGLSIARSLVRRMNGDITLDTTYTDGARFVMSLPLATDN